MDAVMEGVECAQRTGFQMRVLTTIGDLLVSSRPLYPEPSRGKIATVGNDGVMKISNALHPHLLQSFASDMPESPPSTSLLQVIPGQIWQIQ
jgi:hypothetical protein